MTDKAPAIFEGATYLNGRGDVLGPMIPCFMAGWVEDQFGTHYDVSTGVQYGHVKGSTGNIVSLAQTKDDSR